MLHEITFPALGAIITFGAFFREQLYNSRAKRLRDETISYTSPIALLIFIGPIAERIVTHRYYEFPIEGWRTFEKIAGTGIYKDEDDLLNPREPYHWTLGTEQELFRSVTKGKRRLLDVGCGTGRSCLFLAKEMPEIVGIDKSPKMIKIATRKTERAGIKTAGFMIGDAEKLD